MKAAGLIAAVVALGVAGWWGWGQWQTRAALNDLAARAQADLIAVPGGSFMAGNFDINVALEDGTTETRPVATPMNARPATPATLADFALLARAATAQDVALFVADTGRTARPDAALTWQEAIAFCDWLGSLAGIAMRLPTEDEWEYAARSRGAVTPWGTAGGDWPAGTDPSPMGFYGLSSGRYDWVADNTSDVRIAKGGSDRSSAFYETIPSRNAVAPVNAAWPGEPEWLATGGYPYHITYATARCAADTGGQGAGVVDFVPPVVFGPFDAQGNPLQ